LRWYDSTTGRFLTRDPIGFGGGDANLYRYVGNNPLNAVDPWGLETEVLIFAPVGYGRSSFGHVAIVINGTAYSFGQNGWSVEPAWRYVGVRNHFRHGIGLVIDISPEQEQTLEWLIHNNIRMNPNWNLVVQCVTQVRDPLIQALWEVDPSAVPPSGPLFPMEFMRELHSWGVVVEEKFYFKGPKPREELTMSQIRNTADWIRAAYQSMTPQIRNTGNLTTGQ
jgi:hypothetical protein